MTLNKEVSLGDVLTLLIMLAGAIAGYTTLSSTQAGQKEKLEEMRRECVTKEVYSQRIEEVNRRIEALEKANIEAQRERNRR